MAGNGMTAEWRNTTVARYQRRTTRVDEALLGVYLAGTNTRRLKGALAPLLRGGPLSKEAISRLVGRLREDFETWRSRDLAEEDIRYLFLDGWFPKVRIGGRRGDIELQTPPEDFVQLVRAFGGSQFEPVAQAHAPRWLSVTCGVNWNSPRC
jgi:hypothetical protein